MNGYDDAAEAFRLRQELCEELGLDVDDDLQPSREDVLKGRVNSPSALEGGVFRFGNMAMVGHGKQTNSFCGRFEKFMGCSRRELHNKMVFDVKTGSLVNYAGKADLHPVFHSCDKPSCVACYERGWAVREGDNINFRIGEAVKRLDHVTFGDPQHVILSFPASMYGLSEPELRQRCFDALAARGVVGGCVIPHFARFERGRGWYLGIHYHCIGFVLGGMRRCRGCSHANEKGKRFFCKGCDGFYGRSKKCWKSDGIIVEVKDKRKSVFGTAWYQLHHATFDASKVRAHVVTYFGVCSYRRMKIPKEARKEYDLKRKPKCRICGSELVRHEYRGGDPEVLKFFGKKRGAREKVEPFFYDAEYFVELPEVKKWGSGSYG